MNQTGLAAEAIVVGGGPVGSAVAALLGLGGLDCILVCEAAAPGHTPGRVADTRALALTLASRNILRAAGAWEHLPADEIGQFQRMRVWDARGTGAIEFDSAELCLPTLGYIVGQALLERALHAALESRPQVSVLPSSTPESLAWYGDRIVLRLADGRELGARVVIGADGSGSRLRRLAEIEYPVHDYNQQAVVCTVDTALPHENTARQRFLDEGPLAFLPLARAHQCAVVWSTTPDQASALLELEAEAFCGRLADAFDHVLGDVACAGERRLFPLRRAHAARYSRPRIALAGDAAHCVHPLAGQGANLGLLDAASLAEVMVDARDRKRDIGSIRVLRRYERWRRGENAVMLLTLDGLQKLFGFQGTPVPWLRNTGLELVNACNPIKRLIMGLATGIQGDLPAVARCPMRA